MSQAQVDNFVRKLQKLQEDSAQLRDGYQHFQKDILEFCNGDQLTANLMMSLCNDAALGKVKQANIYIDVAADGSVTIGHVCKPKPSEPEAVAHAE